MSECKPYIVEVPLDLHELWATCEQDLLDTMPDHVRERIERDGRDNADQARDDASQRRRYGHAH